MNRLVLLLMDKLPEPKVVETPPVPEPVLDVPPYIGLDEGNLYTIGSGDEPLGATSGSISMSTAATSIGVPDLGFMNPNGLIQFSAQRISLEGAARTVLSLPTNAYIEMNEFVSLNSDGQVIRTIGLLRPIGYTLDQSLQGSVRVAVSGVVDIYPYPVDGLTIGAPVYLDEDGDVQSISGEDTPYQVGILLSRTTLLLQIAPAH